jgi:hypothetical protein
MQCQSTLFLGSSIRMYVCMYVCMYICMYVRMYVCMDVCMDVCVCMYVCMYVCMHVCMYVYIYIYIYIYMHARTCTHSIPWYAFIKTTLVSCARPYTNRHVRIFAYICSTCAYAFIHVCLVLLPWLTAVGCCAMWHLAGWHSPYHLECATWIRSPADMEVVNEKFRYVWLVRPACA